MLSRDAAHAALRRLFRRSPVVVQRDLQEVLQTGNRMSVFRRLSELGHLTSFSHNGRYYTLREVPVFDENGLWFHQGIGFSRMGTLKETAAGDVARAEAGRTHGELEALLHVRLHNTLVDLVRRSRIGRFSFAGRHLYVSADPERAAEQLARREQLTVLIRPLPPSTIIEILVEALREAPAIPAAEVVSARLAARGIPITTEQVRAVFTHHRLEPVKKTASPSKPSRP
jgi:hypothetical protein